MTIENLLKISHLFSPFPNDFKNDSAFFDRIHYYLPGWEIPKIKSQSLTEEFGLISDCFAEFAKEMRKHDYTHVFDEWFKFNKNVNIRDEVAIRKTVSGMIKILYPDLKFTKEDIEELLVYAIEGRRRVKEQLRVISGDEFADLDLGYIRNDGKEVIVNVPEKTNSTLIPKKTLIPGHVSFVGYSLDNKLPGVYRMETKVVDGTGKIEVQGVVGRHRSAAKEAFNAGWKYFLEFANNVTNMPNIFMNDYHIYLNDLQSRSSTSELSVAQFISLCSGILEKSVIDRLAVIGEVTLSGTIQDIKGLEDYVRAAANAGAEIILMPHTCKNAFESITDSKIKNVNPVYYRNPIEACKIALNISEE